MPLPIAQESAFTSQQQQAISLIANGATITEAAATLEIHRNTVSNWRRHVPGFADELELATAEQALYWHEQAVALAPHAIDVLRTTLNNEGSSLSLKLRAATAILKMAANPKNVHKPAQSAPSPAAPLPPPAKKIDMRAYFPPLETIRKPPEPGRNSLCPCGSRLKYKRCCAGALNNSAPPLAHVSACSPPSDPAPI